MYISRNLVAGIVSILIGGVYLFYAYQIPLSSLADTMGAGGVPVAYGWIMVCLGAALSVQSIIDDLKNSEKTTTEKEWKGIGKKILAATGLVSFGIAYLLIVDWLGYLFSIALLLIGVAFYQGAPLASRIILICIGGAAALWLIFVMVLGVSMPLGILDFN